MNVGKAGPRICVLTYRVGPDWEEGPFQRCFRWLLPEVVARGVEVDLVLVGTAERPAWTRRLGPYVLGCDTFSAAQVALADYFDARRPDACLSVDSLLSVLALATATRISAHRPRVYPWQTTLTSRAAAKMPRPTAALLRREAEELYPNASAVLAVSGDCLDDLRAWGVGDVAGGLLPNCVDADEVAAVVGGSTGAAGGVGSFPPEPEHTIIAVGALSWEKGHDALLRAIARLDADALDTRVVILGEGVERPRLTALARELGIERRVVLAGYRGDAWRWLGGASLFVHPSRWEGFGMSLLEAMAAGLPVIATNCPGGPKEILDGGRYGRLVTSEDHRELGDRIEQVLNDPDLRTDLGRNARRRAADYAPARVADRLIEVLCG